MSNIGEEEENLEYRDEYMSEMVYESGVQRTAFREAEHDVQLRLGNTEVIDQCIQIVQENLEEIYKQKVAETEQKYLQTIENLNEKVEDLENKLAALEIQDQANSIEEVIREEYELKYKKLEEELVLKFKEETEDLILKIETEMEEVLESKGISAEKRKELEEEVREEFRMKMHGEHHNCTIHTPTVNQESNVRIVYRNQPPVKDQSEEIEKLKEELEKMREEQAGIGRLKSLWHVRVKKAGEVLKALERDKEAFQAEKEIFLKSKASREVKRSTITSSRSKKISQETEEQELKPAIHGLKIRTEVAQMHADLANKAAELDMAFRQMIDPLETDSSRFPNQEHSLPNDAPPSHRALNSARNREQADHHAPLTHKDYSARPNPFFPEDSSARKPKEESPAKTATLTTEDIDDLVQKKIWNYRENMKSRLEEARKSEQLDFEIKKTTAHSKVKVNQIIKEEAAKKSLLNSVCNESVHQQEEKSAFMSSDRDYSYHPKSVAARLGQRLNSDIINKTDTYTEPAEVLFQLTTPTDNKSFFSKSDLRSKPMYANQEDDFEERSATEQSHEVFKKSRVDHNIKAFAHTSEIESHVIRKEVRHSQIKTETQVKHEIKPTLDYLLGANKALGIEVKPITSQQKELDDPVNILSLIFNSDKSQVEDSRSAALLDLYKEVSKKRRSNTERLAIRITRESKKGTQGVEKLAEIWRDCLADEVELERILDAVEYLSPEQASERVHIEYKYWSKYKEKFSEYLKRLKRRETVRAQLYSIALEFKKIQDIETFNQATAGCYNVLRTIDKSLLKCPKEVTYRGIKVDTLIKLDLFEEEYLHKIQAKVHQKDRFKD